MRSLTFDLFVVCALLAVGCAIGAWLFGGCGERTPHVTTLTVRDTVIVRDTVRAEIPVPRTVEVVRYDTVGLPPAPSEGGGATETTAVVLPMEQVEYKTNDYRAVVEGYRPRLVEMELYRQTQIVNNNTTTTLTKQPRWAITGGVGVGWTPQGVQPYLGVTVGYVIWSR